MRCIFNDNISTYDELLMKTNMPSQQNRRIQDMCILIYKVIYATTPTPISGLLSLRSNECNLRGKMKLILPLKSKLTSKYGLHTFRYYGPKMWNSLQDEPRTAPTIKRFVSQIRKITFVTRHSLLLRNIFLVNFDSNTFISQLIFIYYLSTRHTSCIWKEPNKLQLIEYK